jgi:glycerol-3-phosphate dehydrogenase
MQPLHARDRVAIVGCGAWATAVSRIVGAAVAARPEAFEPDVRMYVREETLPDGSLLSDAISQRHVNPRYLPGFSLPPNVVGVPDVGTAVAGASLLLFIVPHAYLPPLLPPIRASLLRGRQADAQPSQAPSPLQRGQQLSRPVRVLSLIKGLQFQPQSGECVLISDLIRDGLRGVNSVAAEGPTSIETDKCGPDVHQRSVHGITSPRVPPSTRGADDSGGVGAQPMTSHANGGRSATFTDDVDVSVLMGANLAVEVAAGQLSEATLGCSAAASARLWSDLLHAPPAFRVEPVADPVTVELCGALKNVVALGAGFVDGLGCGTNTKAVVLRVGLQVGSGRSRRHASITREWAVVQERAGPAKLRCQDRRWSRTDGTGGSYGLFTGRGEQSLAERRC